jgi:pre-mRNA-processing factor SLU7
MLMCMHHLTVYPGNHTSVWGSWYDRDAHRWGFACCHSTISTSYCVGFAGFSTNAFTGSAADVTVVSSSSQLEIPASKSLVEMHLARNGADGGVHGTGKRKADGEAGTEWNSDVATAKRRLGEGAVRLDESRLEKSLREEEKRLVTDTDDRTRAYNSLHTQDVSEEDLEAYRRKRTGYEDPMANVANDDLLPL